MKAAPPDIREAVLAKLHHAGFSDETAVEALDELADQSGSVEQIIERILMARYPGYEPEPEPELPLNRSWLTSILC
jgi:hypothetical protein